MEDSFAELREFDIDNQLKNIEAWSQLFSTSYKAANQVRLLFNEKKDFQNIIVCGMGGSGISGKIIEDIFKNKSPLTAVNINDYNIPSFVNDKTLVIVISYSGNTEETISAFKESLKRNATIIVVTSNGKLKQMAQQNNITIFPVESGYQPRFGFPLLLGTVLGALNKISLLPLELDIDKMERTLESYNQSMRFSVHVPQNKAKQVALQIYDTVTVIVSNWASISHRTKSQLNENAKMFAYGEVYPELFHNSVSGWLFNIECDLTIVDFFIETDLSSLRKHEKMNFLVQESQSFKTQVSLEFTGQCIMEKLLKAIMFGDFLSYYCALLNKRDPSTIEMIKKLKTI